MNKNNNLLASDVDGPFSPCVKCQRMERYRLSYLQDSRKLATGTQFLHLEETLKGYLDYWAADQILQYSSMASGRDSRDLQELKIQGPQKDNCGYQVFFVSERELNVPIT